nr:hypothetical protein [Tanacetum cinerariifolium]
MLIKPQSFYDHTTKQALGFQNPFYLKKAQQLEPKLYDGNFIQKTNAIVIRDSKETLILAEESRSKMLLKQKDLMMSEKKVNTKPNSVNSAKPTPSTRPTQVEVPKELLEVGMNPNSFDCPPDSYHPPHPTYETYSGDACGNDSHFGYDCPPQFPLNFEPESGYIQNYNSYPHDSPSFPQQYPCCEDC